MRKHILFAIYSRPSLGSLSSILATCIVEQTNVDDAVPNKCRFYLQTRVEAIDIEIDPDR